MTALHPLAQRHWTRNWIAFITDHVGFSLGLVFINTSTTLPAFAAALTDDKVLIGAVSSVWVGGWLLPQILAANYMDARPRKYPIMMWGQFLGRPVLPLFALWLLLGGARYPGLTLALFLAVIVVFMASDAFVALAWLDLFGKAMPAGARGRLVGVAQVITGLASLGAGALIRHLLSPAGPAFPMNYVAIFGLASLFFALSTLGCAIVVEVPEAVAARRTRLGEYLPQIARLWRADRRFALVTAVRLLSGLGTLATSFYVLYATDELRLPASAIGVFAVAATLGTVLAGLVLGLVASRAGPHRVVQAAAWTQCAVPALALAIAAGLLGPAARALFPVLFVLLGIYEGSVLLGTFNYILEIAPPGQRPTYMGLMNTVSGVLIALPLLGGALLERTSYPVLFAAAALGTLAAAVLALRLPPAQASEQLRLPRDRETLGLPGTEG
jgi:MFS family permease